MDNINADLKDELTPERLEELKEILVVRRQELRKNIRDRKESSMRLEKDQIMEDYDLASATQRQTLTLRVMDKEVKLLRQVERALAKFQDGQYGMCEATGEPIAYRRLKLVPWARFTISHKERREREERERSVRGPGR